MKIAEKSIRAKEDYENVFNSGYDKGYINGENNGYTHGLEEGKLAILDESKYMHPTVSGSVLALNDVSPIEHGLNIQLTSDTITDFSGVTVSRYGKNLYNTADAKNAGGANAFDSLEKTEGKIVAISDNSNANKSAVCFGIIENLYYPKGTYTLSFDITVENSQPTNADRLSLYINDGIKAILTYASNVVNGRMTYSFTLDKTSKVKAVWYKMTGSQTTSDTVYKAVFSNIQLEMNNTRTDYEPYIEPQTTPVNIGGSVVYSIKSLSPNMTLLTDTEGVNIECQYFRDIDRFIENQIIDVAITGGE